MVQIPSLIASESGVKHIIRLKGEGVIQTGMSADAAYHALVLLLVQPVQSNIQLVGLVGFQTVVGIDFSHIL